MDLTNLIRSWPYIFPSLQNLNIYSKASFKKKLSSPKIAVIDTGVDLSHPCFHNSSIIPKDFTGGSNPIDEIGHGTHCTAIIAAQKSSGMIGLCPEASIYSAKVLNRVKRNKSSVEHSIRRALEWAIEEKVHMVLITVGCRKANSSSIKTITEEALEKEIIIIAAAGNHAGSLPLFPSTIPGVFCVSALGNNGLPLPECYHGEIVDAFVPGESIRSACIKGWQEMSGSSQAAAIFCGLLAKELAS